MFSVCYPDPAWAPFSRRPRRNPRTIRASRCCVLLVGTKNPSHQTGSTQIKNALNLEINGYAIVSADGKIADRQGDMPCFLHNQADFVLFQTALDGAAMSVLGRMGHERHENSKKRRRLVLSGQADGIERRDDALWWNPALADWQDVVNAAGLQENDKVVVTGGQRVFDTFLSDITGSYNRFYLSVVHGSFLNDGISVFSGVGSLDEVKHVLLMHGLAEKEKSWLDKSAGVELVVFEKSKRGLLQERGFVEAS